MLLNALIIIAIIAVVIIVARKYVLSLNQDVEEVVEEERTGYDVKFFVSEVSDFFSQQLKKRYEDENLSRRELIARNKNKTKLRNSLTKATYGDRNAKRVIKTYIAEYISNEKYDLLHRIDEVIPFSSESKLKSNDKFEIILYFYNLKYGVEGFAKLMDEFELTKPIEENGEKRYAVTKAYINAIYKVAIIEGRSSLGKVTLSYRDKLEILTQRIYQRYTSLGPVDLLYESTVDEIDCGVSGIPDGSFTAKTGEKNMPYSYESIWVTYHGINIQMECLSFETQQELVRVCDNIYKYDAPYVMSRSEGRVVSTMIDGSRIVVCRPPFAESYAFFLRKFDSAPSAKPSELIKDENKVIPIVFMKWLIKGQRNIGITGSQGTGKTTMLKAIIRYIDSIFTLRIQELQFELNLRYAYPKRNIVTFQETANISAQEGLDLQKKTNGAVNIIGEVANAVQACHIIQTAMVASLFAMFTHHAKTAMDFVNAIADNLLQVGLYQDKKDAVRAVAGILNIDIHLTNIKGNRHIERITEIIPSEDIPYPSIYGDRKFAKTYADSLKKAQKMDEEDRRVAAALGMEKSDYLVGCEMEQLKTLMDAREYFHRETDPTLFTTQDLMHWEPITDADGNEVGGRFVLDRLPSEKMMAEIESKLSNDELKDFHEDMEMVQRVGEENVKGMSEWIEKVLSY